MSCRGNSRRKNSNYSAGTFQLSSRTIQFIAFLEKDENNKNQPFPYEAAPDLLVNTTSMKNNFGQFIFPKEILIKYNVFKSSSTKGEMAMRVYLSWDHPTSKQAIRTRKWQLLYLVDLSNMNKLLVI